MAKCYQCNEEIRWRSGKNRRGQRGYIFNCPHCGTECTEHFLTNTAYVIVLCLPLVGVILTLNRDMGKIMLAILVWGVIYLPLSRYLWWKFAARLAKPFTLKLF